MRLIERKGYLDRIKRVIGTPDIKVLTGVRRSGKSKLLEALRDYVSADIPNANIVHINFNLVENEPYEEYHVLHEFIEKSYKKDCNNFLLIDEVQMCPNFEKTINSIHAMELFDIYITGSNAFLLSSDLATLFTGRTYEIKVFPFSFLEFKDYFEISDNYQAFDRYMKEGGMAGSYPYMDQEAKNEYIRDVFGTLILRNIKQKYRIRNISMMDRIVDYLMDNISNQTSSRNISDVFERRNEKISHKTVDSYLEYLCNAFAFYKFQRYDIRGKKYLSSNVKYYLCDHSIRYAKLGTRNMDHGRILENIVAIELLRRGYEVYVGVLYKKEIDFVAMKRSEKIYIQVSDNINDEKTFEREVTPLLQIKDAYPKMIIARTRNEEYQYEGVRIIDIADWLSDNK